jgi:hypothetical protein
MKVLAAWPGMAHRLAAERQRDAMFEAWGGGSGGGASSAPAAPGNGFQAVALGLSQRGGRVATAGRGLLDPVPAEIAVARRADRAARPRFEEVAEAAAAAPRRR